MEHRIVLILNTDHSEQEIRLELGYLEVVCGDYMQCAVTATYSDECEQDHTRAVMKTETMEVMR